ncbi:XrtA/PEP-CTERM system histidine kinase PrsK [Sphingomonas sp. GV3]|uniref:XrtA/PEP-CTERM system histidine kinase PrsK n=1 Tax=Sphingomonas sp. GV3 TaxID=3040671 RepID=UPI00280AF9E4|nr:XrtA/PEP-CTERM system histidine kinase PrsK [Sphingomonas sp. GV3]
MTLALILWGYAIAALAFGVLAVAVARGPASLPARVGLTSALGLTALWALAVAGIAARDPVTTLAESLRNVAWLALLWYLVRRARAGNVALTALYLVTAAVNAGAVVLALLQTLPLGTDVAAAVGGVWLAARMVGALLGLMLCHQYATRVAAIGGSAALLPGIALAGMWTMDLALAVLAYGLDGWPDAMVAMRGFGMVAVAALMLPAAMASDRTLTVSHGGALRLLSGFAVLLYVALTLALLRVAEGLAGTHARIAETAIVCGATAALGTVLTAPWLRAWAKVKLAKHFFDHRYDYRVEWQRFAARLGAPGSGEPLGQRVVRALADLTDSPGGLLLVAAGEGLERDAAWNWSAPGDADAALAAHLAGSERIVALDEVRGGLAPVEEAAVVPDWMRAQADAWALVPLLHGRDLVGAVLLARPPVDRSLDWEDLDLLRIAGRQAAGYLAEERAHVALAEAARFDEFNRRFAFILHDIKNLVSGVSLVARNAERHADNPAFRADMIATLQDSAARMNALLSRLSQHHLSQPEALQPVDAGALAARIARRRRAQHPVEARGAGVARAHPGRLEQLLDHLVQNALEASAPDAPVMIEVAEADECVTIVVADRGCGMSPAFVRDRLFRPFASSKPGGFGIGAYEARQLAAAMDGTIAVTSREGEGSRFTVTLPLAAPAEAAA